jgi:4-hydroxybenzoate-CoA ligase
MTNAALYFVDRHVFAGREDKIAFHEYPSGCVLTYGMLAAQSDKAGIATEERAAMLVPHINSVHKKRGREIAAPS